MAVAAESPVPAVSTVLGIDEAGRGAVLGPLVVAGVVVGEDRLCELSALGARDSKAVPRARRGEIVRALARSGARGKAIVIPAPVVDDANLTALELGAAACLIRDLHPSRVVLDAPVAPLALPRFLLSLSLRSAFPPAELAAFPKADRDHPAVAAASLLAKVVRDGYVVALRRHFGDFGWGYPGEPKVQAYLEAWLAERGTLPPICRTRWRSVQALVAPELWERRGSCAAALAKGECPELR